MDEYGVEGSSDEDNTQPSDDDDNFDDGTKAILNITQQFKQLK